MLTTIATWWHYLLGKRGERDVPDEPASAPVWTEIVRNHAALGFDGVHVSTESVTRAELRRHPWVLAGGGARTVLQSFDARGAALKSVATTGVFGMTNADDCYSVEEGVFIRHQVEPKSTRPILSGDSPRDWSAAPEACCVFPYDDAGVLIALVFL